MSGSKCGEVNLRRRYREALRSIVASMAQVNAITAQLTRTVAQAQFLMQQREKGLERYMPNEYKELQIRCAELERSGEQVQALLKRYQEVSNAKRQSKLNETFIIAARDRLAADLAGLKTTFRSIAAQIDSVVALSTTIRDHYQDVVETVVLEQLLERERRNQVRLLVSELQSRLQSPHDTLLWVPDRANELLSRLSYLAESSAPINDEHVAAARKDFEALLHDAQAIELEGIERWHIVQLLCEAFEGSGFTPLWELDHREAIGTDAVRLGHQLSGDLTAEIHTTVPWRDRIQLEMMGPVGAGSVTLGPDQRCSENLQQIIARAKKLGLNFTRIYWKNPDGELELIFEDRGAVEEEEQHQAKPQLMEQGLPH